MTTLETLWPMALRPYDPAEAMTTREAAHLARRTEACIRQWAVAKGIGRRIGGSWAISRVALAMFLDGADAELAAYHRGVRHANGVDTYFYKLGLQRLLYAWAIEENSSQITQSSQETKNVA